MRDARLSKSPFSDVGASGDPRKLSGERGFEEKKRSVQSGSEVCLSGCFALSRNVVDIV